MKYLQELYFKNTVYSFDIIELKLQSRLIKLDLSNSIFINLDQKVESFSSLKYLDVSSNKTVNDEFLSSLGNIEYLNISYCTQTKITDESLSKLKSLKSLNMRFCSQNTLTDSLFKELTLTDLNISYCTQLTIETIQHIKGIKSLDVSYTTLSTQALKNLGGIININVSGCDNVEYKTLKSYLEEERSKVKFLDHANLEFIY